MIGIDIVSIQQLGVVLVFFVVLMAFFWLDSHR